MNSTPLSPEQTQAIRSPAPHNLVVAGPGSGKTRTLIAMTAALLARGVPPRKIGLVTYTNAAADEMAHRLTTWGVLQPGQRLGHCGTLHGLMLRLLQRHGHVVGLPRELAVMSEDVEAELIEATLDALSLKKVTKKALLSTMRHGPVPIVAKAQAGDALTDPEIAASRIWTRMTQAGLVTFDMILHLGLQLLNAPEFPGAGISHLLVDEFQDASEVDAGIYDALRPEWSFYVGDPDQSIYAFRGADVRQIVAASKQRRTFLLQTNYRSTWNITAPADALIAHNPDRIQKRTLPADPEKKGRSVIAEFDFIGDERAAVVEDMKRLFRAGKVLPKEVGLLCRTNWLVAEWAKTLEYAGIPVVRKVIPEPPKGWDDAMRLMTLLAVPDNDFLAEWWIKRQQGAEAAKAAQRKALGALQSINAAVLGMKRIEDVSPDGPGAQALLGELLRAGIPQTTVAGIEKGLALLDPESRTLPDLILHLRGMAYTGTDVGDPEGVTVSTFHSAKGREWELVYMPSFDGEGNKQGEEERRLVYVALTRAKTGLAITASRNRHGQWAKVAGPVPPHPMNCEICLSVADPASGLLHPGDWLNAPPAPASARDGAES